jgi:hypothetical protein
LKPKFAKSRKGSIIQTFSSSDEEEESEQEEKEEQEVEETSEKESETPSRSERIEALQLRSKIAQNVLTIGDMINHVDLLEMGNFDPTSFLVETQVILYDIVQQTTDLINQYDQQIGIYEEFSFDHSKEVRELLKAIRIFSQASYCDLYEVWHQVRQDFQVVMDILRFDPYQNRSFWANFHCIS